MRIIRRLIRRLFWILVMTGCQSLTGGGEAPFDFSVRADSVTEGDDLTVSVDIEKGSFEEYLFGWELKEVEVSTGREWPVKAEIYYGEVPVSPGNYVSLPNSGHADFRIPGLEVATYRITITLTKDGLSKSSSCLAVVSRKDPNNTEGPDGPDGPDGPGTDTTTTPVTPPDPPAVAAEDFTIPQVDPSNNRLNIKTGETLRFTPAITPDNVTDRTFAVVSSDESVVKGRYENGQLVFEALCPGKASVTITADGGEGLTKTLPVMVYSEVKVRIEFEELEASDAQLRTKTFPCKLKFTSDSPVPFSSPLVWSVTMKSVVNCTGHDSTTLEDKRDVEFKGSRTAYYDITTNMLIPSYNLWKNDTYTYSLTLSAVLSNSLDPEMWRLSFDEVYKSQTSARIWQYLTLLQQ